MEDGLISCDDVAANVIIENSDMELSAENECTEEIIMMQSQATTSQNIEIRSNKRGRDQTEEEEWITVGRDGKRVKHKVEITMTSVEKLPKQFALAKLFSSNNILNISRVKYLNPYKVLLQFDNETDASQLITCDQIIQLGWRCTRPYEVGISYGVIKDVELDIIEKDIIEIISSPYELIAAKRLKRRNFDGTGWIESETVRLGFKGPNLPEHVCIYGMKIKVNPYVFPVTQCTKCWKYGHTLRNCPSKKDVCPKCSKNHDNCEVTEFKCVNCTGRHRAFDRICPLYIKEKRVRDIMAKNNYSYRQAMILYTPQRRNDERPTSKPELVDETIVDSAVPKLSTEQEDINITSYSAKLKSTGNKDLNKDSGTSQQKDSFDRTAGNKVRKKKKNRSQEENINDWDMSSNASETLENANTREEDSRTKQKRTERDRSKPTGISFKQLINKLQSLYFSDEHEDIISKIKYGISLIVEWITTGAIQYLCELPFKINFG